MNEKIGIKSQEAKKEISLYQKQNTDLSQPGNAPFDHTLYLRRNLGNQAMQRLMESGIQRKSTCPGCSVDVEEQTPGNDLIMRSCSDHPEEDYYSSNERYCLDTWFSPITHSGKRCYREIPEKDSYFDCPPAEHVCFDDEGRCESSPDEAAPAEGREDDGSCNWSGYCVAAHTAIDFVPAVYNEMIQAGARGMGRLEQEMLRRMFPFGPIPF